MKSFAKTFRTFLAMSLVLCMVMSCVAVSADDTVTLTQIDVATEPDANGYYQVQYRVGGISQGGSATILVYETNEANEISNATIEYANQAVADEPNANDTYEKTFTMLLDNGSYNVLAGGSGFATAAFGTTLTTGSAPTVTVTPVTTNINNEAAAGTKVADFTIVDNDEAANVETVELSGTGSENFAVVWTKGAETGAAGTIVVAENANLTATTYSDLVLTVTDAEGMTGTCTVAITIDSSVETVKLTATTKNIDKDWNTTEITAPTVADYITLEGATLSAWSEGVVDGAVTTYTATVTLPTGYQFEGGTTTEIVTYTVTEIDTRTVVKLAYTASYAVNYGEVKPEFGAITFVKADDDTAIEIPAENVTLGGWEGEEFNSEVNDGATYTYTNAVTLSGPYKFEDDGLTATASVTVTVTDDREEIPVPEFDDITIYYGDAEPVEALKELAANNVTLGEWVRENAEEEFDSCVDGGITYTYTNKATANAKFKFAEGALEALVEVTVVVKDERIEITGVKLSETDIPVAWNGAEPTDKLAAIIATAIVGEEETELVLKLSEFALASGVEFNNEEENYVNTYYAVASIPEDSVNGYKFADGVANVEVTVTIEEKVTITAKPVGETTFTVPYGTDIETEDTITTTYTAAVEDADAVDVAVAWNYEDFNKDVPDTYTITGTLTAPAGYKFANEADATVTVTVVVEEPSYVVDAYTFFDAEGNEVTEVYVEDPTMSFIEAVDAKIIPAKVALTAGTETTEITLTEESWIEPTNFPPQAWDFVNVYLTDAIELPTYWSFDAEDMPYIKVITKGDVAFDVEVDGYAKTSVASLKTQDATVEIVSLEEGKEIAGIAEGAAYGFVVDGAPEVWQDTPVITVAKDDAIGKHTVTARVKLADGSISEPQTVYIYKYTTLFNGNVYINDTANEEEAYSAVRANKNRPITVTYDYTFANNKDYNFATGTATLNVYKAGNENGEPVYGPVTFESGVKEIAVPANILSDNASYRFVVTYTDEDEKVGSKIAARYTYVSNVGTWYSDFTINNMTRSGIIVRKDETLTNEFTLTDLGADGKAFIGYALIGYNDIFEDIEANKYVETTEKTNTHTYDLTTDFANKANASYKFYSLAKLDSADQTYLDMNVSRVVYIYDNKTSISNLRFGENGEQGATSGPKPDADGYITIAPYWYQEFSKDTYNYNEPISYKLTFVSGVEAADLAAEGAVVGGTVDDTTVSFADTKVGYNGESGIGSVKIKADVFGRKVVAKLDVYIDGEFDRTVEKTFWPQAQ